MPSFTFHVTHHSPMRPRTQWNEPHRHLIRSSPGKYLKHLYLHGHIHRAHRLNQARLRLHWTSMTDPAPARRYRFGVFEADAVTGELRRQGIRVKLNAQPFQVLCLLLERPGDLLTREEISRELWPDGTFVDYEHGVNSAVNRIREALGDTASSPRFVETLARRGYRFVAPVDRIGGDVTSAPVAPGVPVAPASSKRAAARACVVKRDPGVPGGTSQDLVCRGADAFRSAAVDVPGLLYRGTGQPGGDRRSALRARPTLRRYSCYCWLPLE